jgi:hypothetical protein
MTLYGFSFTPALLPGRGESARAEGSFVKRELLKVSQQKTPPGVTGISTQ